MLRAPPLPWSTIAGCLGLSGLAFWPVPSLHGPLHFLWIALLAGASGALLARARGWNRSALGLVLRLEPDAGFWLRASGWMAGVVLAAFAVAVLFSRNGIDPLGLCAPQPPLTGLALFQWLVFAPVVEEWVFRFVLCGALAGRASNAASIAMSGGAFALTHIVLGGIGPDSLVGGFLLAWAFLRSGSIALPVALHALGNAALVALEASRWLHALACRG